MTVVFVLDPPTFSRRISTGGRVFVVESPEGSGGSSWPVKSIRLGISRATFSGDQGVHRGTTGDCLEERASVQYFDVTDER